MFLISRHLTQETVFCSFLRIFLSINFVLVSLSRLPFKRSLGKQIQHD